MIKRILVTGMCISSLLVCGGCDNSTTSSGKETSAIIPDETVQNTDVVAKPNHTEKIMSVEQKDIYEEYEGYNIKKMYSKMKTEVGINIRKGPGESYQRLDGLNRNEVVNVIGQCQESGWYMALFSSGVGFVSNQYLVNAENDSKLVLGEECPHYLYVKTSYNGQIGWFYRDDIGWQCKDYENVVNDIVGSGYEVENFPVYVGTWRDVGDVMWIGYTKE